MQSSWPANPYLGLQSYRREHRPLFAGRDREAEELLSRIMGNPFVFLYSRSGAGKSSLINALLQERLEEQGFTVFLLRNFAAVPKDPAAPLLSANLFFHNLALSLFDEISLKVAVLEQSEAGIAAEEFHQRQLNKRVFGQILQRFGRPEANGSGVGQEKIYALQERLQNLNEVAPPESLEAVGNEEAPFVLICDQAEEIFTAAESYWQHREPFFKGVIAMAQALPQARFVFSFREEFLAFFERSLRHPHLHPFHFHLNLLDQKKAVQAIVRPTELREAHNGRDRVYDKKYAPGLPELIANELAQIRDSREKDARVFIPGEYVEPVQLQLVCHTLWAKPGLGEEITFAHWDEIGRGEKVLVDYYEESLRELRREPGFPGEEELRDWIDNELITELNTRNYKLINNKANEVAGMPLTIIKALEDRRLLRTEDRAGASWVFLSHDRLINAIRQSHDRFRRLHTQKRYRRFELMAGLVTVLAALGALLFADKWIASSQTTGEQALRHLLSAKTHFQKRNFAAAEHELYESIRNAPTAEASLLLGKTLEQLGKDTLALQQYQNTAQLAEGETEAYLRAGLLRLEMKDSAAAFMDLEKYFERSERPPREILAAPLYAEMVRYYFSEHIKTDARRLQALNHAIALRHRLVRYISGGRSPQIGFDGFGFVTYLLENGQIISSRPRDLPGLESRFTRTAEPKPMDLVVAKGQAELPLFYLGRFFKEELFLGIGLTAFVEIVERQQVPGELHSYHVPY